MHRPSSSGVTVFGQHSLPSACNGSPGRCRSYLNTKHAQTLPGPEKHDAEVFMLLYTCILCRSIHAQVPPRIVVKWHNVLPGFSAIRW